MSDFDDDTVDGNPFDGGSTGYDSGDGGDSIRFTGVPEDTTTASVNDAGDDTDGTNGSGKSARADEGRSRRPKRTSRRAAVSAQTVESVLGWKERLDSTDQKIKDLAADLLGVRTVDDARLISSLMDADSVASARRSISEALDLAEMDDMKFAIQVSKMDKNQRKSLYALESTIDPDLAGELTEGANRLPNDMYGEITLLRSMQKQSAAFRPTLDAITAFLG